VRDRWSNRFAEAKGYEGWHWIRDTQLHEDSHRYRGNGAGAMATLRTAALSLLRLAVFQSIRAGMQAVTHDITALLVMAMRKPEPSSSYDFESALRQAHPRRWSRSTRCMRQPEEVWINKPPEGLESNQALQFFQA
jgi:hypothetical protein